LPEFDFTAIADLELNDLEMQVVNDIFSKQKVNQAYWQETPQEFVSNFIRCVRSCVPCNTVPSVVIAQAILESGWFSTNSLFGVKATKLQVSQGIGIQSNTQEVVNGTSVPTVGTFFENPSLQKNFANYFEYISRMKPDSKNFIPFNNIGFINYLQANPAYSTAGGSYINSVMDVIRSNSLTVFDHN